MLFWILKCSYLNEIELDGKCGPEAGQGQSRRTSVRRLGHSGVALLGGCGPFQLPFSEAQHHQLLGMGLQVTSG